MTVALCRECRVEIEWAVFDRSNKAVPLDVGVKVDGNLTVVGIRGGTVPVVRILKLSELELVREQGLGLRRAHAHWVR